MGIWGQVLSDTEIGDTPVKNVFAESAAPGVNDDDTQDFSPGSAWVDTTNDNVYVCTDASTGAANWEQINGTGSGSATMEIFYPNIVGTTLNRTGDFGGRNVGGNGDLRFSWRVPHNFSSLTDIALVCIPAITVGSPGVDIDYFSDYGPTGGAFNANSESDTSNREIVTANQIQEFDVSSVYSSLSANQYCGLLASHNAIGGNILYLGMRLRYT